MIENISNKVGKENSNTSSQAFLNDAQGRVLLVLARHALIKYFGKEISSEDEELLRRQLGNKIFQQKFATFVTLKIKGQLRGCIGTLEARDDLADSVRANAINAAFYDPRFEPLTESELAQIVIEVSVLTPSEPLLYHHVNELVAKLHPGVDGVTIRKGSASATFLPQVWDQLKSPEMFLSHLCLKAGLVMNAWRKGDLDVETYQVQYFEEE